MIGTIVGLRIVANHDALCARRNSKGGRNATVIFLARDPFSNMVWTAYRRMSMRKHCGSGVGCGSPHFPAQLLWLVVGHSDAKRHRRCSILG
jgi:hypothetical protein